MTRLLLIVLTLPALASCLTSGADFSDVMHRDWILAEVRTGTRSVVLDREMHRQLGFGDIFTLRFEDDLAVGTAMPNTFRGPFTLGEERALTFGPMATTRMAAFAEPQELNEHEFLAGMGSVVGWNLNGENLELNTLAYGIAGVMIFVPLD